MVNPLAAAIAGTITEYLSTANRCDSEQGVAEVLAADGTVDLWVYRSACSIPAGVWEDICHMRVTGDCACGCGDPLLAHPCIGHDSYTGLPLEGPSRHRYRFNH